MAEPADYPLKLYRGDTYALQCVLWEDSDKTVPTDLTGAAAAAEIRDKAGGSNLLATFVCTIELPNKINVVLPATASLAVTATKGAWDLQVDFDDGRVRTVLAGAVSMRADVTRLPAPPILSAVA